MLRRRTPQSKHRDDDLFPDVQPPVSDAAPPPLFESETQILRKQLAESKAQLDLYEFQIRNLRQDLDQLKMQSVLAHLGGMGESKPHQVSVEGGDAPEDVDPDLYGRLYAPDEEHRNLSLLYNWYAVQASAAHTPAAPRANNMSIAGMRQNLRAGALTVTRLDQLLRESKSLIKNRDIQIQLLKDRLDIEQQKLRTDYTERREFDALRQRLEEYEQKARELDLELQKNAAMEDQLSRARERMTALEQQNQTLAGAVEDERRRLATEFVPQTALLELRREFDAYQAEHKQQDEDNKARIEMLEADLRMRDEDERKLRESIQLLEQQNQIQAERYEALKRDAGMRDMESETQMLELRRARDLAEKKLAHHTQRLSREYKDIREIITERDGAFSELQEQVQALQEENQALSRTNQELAGSLAATRRKLSQLTEQHKAEDMDKSTFDEIKRKLLDEFAAGGSPGTLLDLRQLFLKSRQYVDAVRTFRQMLVDPQNQKLMPAVCLLVGEFYGLAGRKEEAAFYLANPLIRNDSYAQHLLRKIRPGQRPGGE